MKLKKITLSLVGLCLATTTFAESKEGKVEQNQLEAGFLQVLEGDKEKKASDMYLESWKAGYSYSHEASYKMNCVIKLAHKDKKEDSWKDFLSNMFYSQVTKVLADGAPVTGRFEGTSVATTDVFSDGETLKLLRSYPRVHSERKLYLDVNIPINESFWKYYTEEEGFTETIISGSGFVGPLALIAITALDGGATAGWLASCSATNPEAVITATTLGYKAADYLGNTLKNKFNDMLEKSKIERTDAGYFRIDSQGDLFKKHIKDAGKDISLADNFGAVGVDFAEYFNTESFYLEIDKSNGKITKLKNPKDDRDFTRFFDAFSNQENIENLTSVIERLEDAPEKAVAVFQRESFAINEEVFGGKDREIGDVWEVSADFFNTFLHPDLTGEISGRVVLKRTDDDVVRNLRTKEKMKVRVIEIQNKAIINGKYAYSNLKYAEKGLSIKWETTSMGYLYIDVNSGVIVEAHLTYDASSTSKLPKMLLTDGFKSAGDIDLTIDYNCYATKIFDRN